MSTWFRRGAALSVLGTKACLGASVQAPGPVRANAQFKSRGRYGSAAGELFGELFGQSSRALSQTSQERCDSVRHHFPRFLVRVQSRLPAASVSKPRIPNEQPRRESGLFAVRPL